MSADKRRPYPAAITMAETMCSQSGILEGDETPRPRRGRAACTPYAAHSGLICLTAHAKPTTPTLSRRRRSATQSRAKVGPNDAASDASRLFEKKRHVTDPISHLGPGGNAGLWEILRFACPPSAARMRRMCVMVSLRDYELFL